MDPAKLNCCQPGDIIVTPIPGGFMLGRMLPELLSSGLWWEYIRVITEESTALQEARRLAAMTKAHAWLSRGADEYTPITQED
jgi:hypothetical protein